MKIFELRLWTGSPQPAFAFSTRNFLDALHRRLADHHNGACHGETTDALVIAQVRAPAIATFMPLVEAYAAKQRKETPDLKLLINEAPHSVLTTEQERIAESLNPEPTKLTRKYFMSLSSGSFIASNVWHEGREAFAENVANTFEGREAQWKRIVASGAAQRLCGVFPSENHFRKWASAMRRYFGLAPLSTDDGENHITR